MDDDEFLTIVQQRLGIGREQAERATRATVETLAQRIAAGEARDLAAELPPELAPWLNAPSEAERFDVDEFLRRVAEREDIDVETAERHARAVFAALSRAISPKELSDTVAELPKDFRAAAAERTPYRVPLGRRLRATGRRQLHQLEAQSLLPDGDDQRRALGEQRARLAHRLLGWRRTCRTR